MLWPGFRIKRHSGVATATTLCTRSWLNIYVSNKNLNQRFLLWVEQQRLALREFVARQPVQQKGLLLALLSGDESLLDQATEEQFQRFGMSHLLAISGPHVLIFAFIVCGSVAISDFKVRTADLSEMAKAVFFESAFFVMCITVLCLCRFCIFQRYALY